MVRSALSSRGRFRPRPSWTRWLGIGIALGAILGASGTVALTYWAHASPARLLGTGTGNLSVSIGPLNFTSVVSGPLPNGSRQPVVLWGWDEGGGSQSPRAGRPTTLGLTFSDVVVGSTVSCALTSLTVSTPFRLISVQVTVRPPNFNGTTGENQSLPLVLPPPPPEPVDGAPYYYGDVWLNVLPPDAPGAYPIYVQGSVVCG